MFGTDAYLVGFRGGQSPCLVPERWKAMRNRLVFPVRDEEGRLAGFAARRLSDEDRDKPKYVNSETGGLYRKSELLYGLYEARECDPPGGERLSGGRI